MIIVFSFLKRHVRHRNKKRINPFYLISVIFISIGMIIGYFNLNIVDAIILPKSTQPFLVFKFSLIKNSVLLIFMFLNAFSVLGFPITSTILVLNGYLVTVSVANMYINALNTEKIVFLIYNFPHIALVVTANILLSESVYNFSQKLFLMISKNAYRSGLGLKFKELIIRFIICISIIVMAALYEAYIL